MTRHGVLAELCRVFYAKERAMLCAMSHGQVSIDGWIIRPQHAERWGREQMRGRRARLSSNGKVFREAILYG